MFNCCIVHVMGGSFYETSTKEYPGDQLIQVKIILRHIFKYIEHMQNYRLQLLRVFDIRPSNNGGCSFFFFTLLTECFNGVSKGNGFQLNVWSKL